MASKEFTKKFRKESLNGMNVQGTDIRRLPGGTEDRVVFLLGPENPRAATRKTIVPVKIVPMKIRDGEWRDTQFSFPPYWPKTHPFSVHVKSINLYYFRYLDQTKDRNYILSKPSHKLPVDIPPEAQRLWKNFEKRHIFYPVSTIAVLAYRSRVKVNNRRSEIICAIPELGISLVDDVRVKCGGKFNLEDGRMEWIPLYWGGERGKEPTSWGLQQFKSTKKSARNRRKGTIGEN